MKLTKVSKQFDIFMSDDRDETQSKPVIRHDGKAYHRFMDRLYVPDLVYQLSPEYVKELNNVREKYALSVIDLEYNDTVVSKAIEYVAKSVPSESNILDFGCGDGYAGEMISRQLVGSSVYGYDVRKPLRRKRLENYAAVTFKSAKSKLPYSTEFFDAVFAFFVFQFYVSDFQLREIARVLKPSGVFYLNLINSSDFAVLHRISSMGFSLMSEEEYVTAKNSGHGFFFSLREE